MNELTTTAGRREALREELVASAERRIAESGYRALRARDLARDVGCALGAIYLVFPDLDALIMAVKDRTLEALERRAGEIATPASGAKKTGGGAVRRREEAIESLKALAALYLGFARDNRNLWRALFEHRPAPETPTAAPAKLDAIFFHVERQLDVLAPERPRGKRRLLAHAVLGAVHGVVTLGLESGIGSPGEEDVAWQVEQIVDLAARGLASSSPATAARKAPVRRRRSVDGRVGNSAPRTGGGKS